MQQTFLEALKSGQCFLFDGSTPTVLYERGVYIKSSFDEANLASPELVRNIHRDFREAGAQVLTTNTWAANEVKLGHYGLAPKLHDINIAGARLAREALQEGPGGSATGWVAGAMGPLGLRMEPWGPTSLEDAKACFKRQATALIAGSVDLFILECFNDLNEIHQAMQAIQEICDLPIAATLTPDEEGQTLHGAELDWCIHKLSQWGASMVGVNGGNGPAALLEVQKRLRATIKAPLLLQPNAGLPRLVDGRLLYMASPEYLGEFSRQAFQLGASAVGGCAGTTPAHTRAMRGALAQEKAFAFSRPEFMQMEPSTGQVQPQVPLEERSRLGRKLSRGEKIVTVELVPPKGTSSASLLEKAKLVRSLGADCINIPDGPRAMARMSVLAAAVQIEREVRIETVMHYTCRDRNLLGIQGDLLGASALGIRNVLAITGDPPKVGPYPHATAVYDVDAIGLVNILTKLNSGLDLGGGSIGSPTAFGIGVGANPAAIDLDREKERYRQKADAGAEWAITQPVFDRDSLLRFLDFAKTYRLPVVAGLWPLRSLREAQFMANEVPGVHMPASILERMARYSSAEDQQWTGLELAIELMDALCDAVDGWQISAPMGQVQILDGLLARAGCIPLPTPEEFAGGA